MKRLSMCLALVAAGLLASCASPSVAPGIELLGAAAPTAGATQTIVITPETRWVNVTGGETVRFIVGDKEFAWNFAVAQTISSFALNRVAPPGILGRTVVAYIAPDPYYNRGGSDAEAPGSAR